jgi:hypothetical protein
MDCDHYNYRKSLRFLFTQKHLLFLWKSRTLCSSKKLSSALFFSGNFDVSAEQNLSCNQRLARSVGIRGARVKHCVSTGTLGAKIKPIPDSAEISLISGSIMRHGLVAF